MKKKVFSKICLLLTSLLCAMSLHATTKRANPIEQQQFVQQLIQNNHLSRADVNEALSHAKYLPAVIHKINAPYEAQPFDVYSRHFLTQDRIDQGALFWKKHQKVLALAEKQYGVDPSIIIAILGVETFYGQNEGNYSVLNALYTLSFFYPARAHFFMRELGEYLVMCHNQNLPPEKIKGSYAGAFGMPQFMPSSYRAYGIDFSRNHHINLMTNANDVIMSVANFLAKAGWTAHASVASPIHHINKKRLQPYLRALATPNVSTAELAKKGIYHATASTHQYVSIIALNDSQHDEYWIAFPNFKSIMHYNPSLNYAMAVYQLSEAIRKQHDKHTS